MINLGDKTELLWRRHHEVAPYPPGVVPVPELIPGTAFFPGGRGVWQWEPHLPLPELPVGGIMVLGHDFHSETEYSASLRRGHERRTQATWRTLIALLDATHIHPLTCFFTNVFMGLRARSETMGRFPGGDDPAFVDRCLGFLELQIETFKPGFILTLGRFVPALLARLSPDLSDWRTATRMPEIDDRRPFREVVRFGTGMSATSTAVVALTHPAQRRLNVGRRRYCGLQGDEAERRMIADACATLPRYQVPGLLPEWVRVPS